MITPKPLRLIHLLVALVGATLTSACADRSVIGPERSPRSPLLLSDEPRLAAAPALGSCEKLQAPPGNVSVLRAFARGVQIYRWTGVSWTLVGPSADLYADAKGSARIGIHYAGPYWESVSGSKVKGALIDRCPSNADAIDWLALAGTPDGGAGIFQDVTFIQRVNTTEGKAPTTSGTLGEMRAVPYTAEYYFYRAP